MSQFSFSSFDSLLHVRDELGRYRLASAEQILQAAREAIEQKYRRGISFTVPAVSKEYFKAKLAGLEREVFAVAFLDSQHRLLDYQELFQGTIDASEVHPREVVKAALMTNAAAVILAHPHPSGSPEPSKADEAVTRTLTRALDLVDVRVLDHIIVAGTTTTSMAERGLL